MSSDPVSRARRRWLAASVAAAGLAALLAWLARTDSANAGVGRPAAPAHGTPPRLPDNPGGAAAPPPLPSSPTSHIERRRVLLEQLALSERTYCGYLQATRYPPGSRPIAEQPDQVYPNAPIVDLHAMREEGGAGNATNATNATVRIQTSQSRVHLAAGESVALSLRALDQHGQVLPLVVTRAVAQGLVFGARRAAPQLALAFLDDGAAPDLAAGDGTHAAGFAPGQTSLAGFDGTIRIQVRFSVGGRAGTLAFDVIYSPEVPAAWTGEVREALEDGSLSFYLKANVRQAGRYIVSARVDDARGQPVALLTFNELLPAGPAQVKLTMFGKLLRDQAPAMPLVLRDVDGYLLKENADPDRALMARLQGPVQRARPQPLEAFADAEWQSEERTRHLQEFSRDLARARAELGEFDRAIVPPPSECSSKRLNLAAP